MISDYGLKIQMIKSAVIKCMVVMLKKRKNIIYMPSGVKKKNKKTEEGELKIAFFHMYR